MLPVVAMPMPGALRLRGLHTLIEEDGSCALIYDLERAAVVEVPEELRLHIAPALETGDLDESVLGWLASEDLLTSEGGAGWTDLAENASAQELAGGWNLGTIYRVDDELHAHIEQAREEAALEIIGFVLPQNADAGRVKLHLSWGGALPARGVLERIVVAASRQAALLHQEIVFELTLDAREVTPAVADLLSGLAVEVRLLCGSYPARTQDFHTGHGRAPAWPAAPAVRLLLDRLHERLTVHCVLDQGRLLDVWEWAKRTGVRHLDATVLEDSAVGEDAWRGRLREARVDLMKVCDEMADALATQRLPVDFKPLTRIVDRLMHSEPLDSLYGERTRFGGLMPVADIYPRSFLDRLDLRPAPSLWGDEDGDASGDAEPCRGCWAHHVCSHSTYVATSQNGEDEPSEERCGLWRTEVETALRFYHRLAHADPLRVRRFFEVSSHEQGSALIRGADLDHLRMPF
ncbi:MAG TPA: hypothetical protein VGS07_29620 [Thermoanaerobaculia bacterium]|jgi:hypothetical protein|nr:hypothetical protein [Thermoanaerobaculia bacterium]